MAEFSLNLVGQRVRVSTLHNSTVRYCENFIMDETSDVDISVVMTQADIDNESVRCNRERAVEGLPPHRFTDADLEITAVQRKITEELFQYDTLLFHGSVVAVDGQAYLFTAKSGTGKSTHTRLWRELFGDRAVMVNDDKPFLKITDSGVIAYGSPWNGKHRLGSDIAVPLKAICVLERGEQNHIQAVPPRYVLSMLIQQSSRPMNGMWMPKYMELIDGLSRHVGFYRMHCNMGLEAARIAFETMSKID